MRPPDKPDIDDMIRESERVQTELAKAVIQEDGFDRGVNLVTGVDVAYRKDTAFACAVTMELANLSVMSEITHEAPSLFPYVPGHFHLREAPVIIELLEEMEDVDLLLIDGNGVLHPRRFGLACHVGLKLDTPTIGVAKSLLLGEVQEREGNRAPVSVNGEVVGCAVWVQNRKKPVYVSVGHRISLDTAVDIVEKVSVHGEPEPIRLADLCAGKAQ